MHTTAETRDRIGRKAGHHGWRSRAGNVALLLATIAVMAAPGTSSAHVTQGEGDLGRSIAACREPHPCDETWAGAGRGPYSLDRVEEVRIDSHDGADLHGWVAFPELPADVTRAPVLLHSSPYVAACVLLAVPGESGCVPGPEDDAFWSDEPSPGATRAWGVPPIELVRRGYVLAFFDVRGTGGSGGCLGWGSEDETRDQKALVDWLASQPWSTGRVGMGGNSYPAATAWQAAVQAPAGLKTIVTAGIVTDWYTFFHSPQGASNTFFVDAAAHVETSTAWLPHAGAGATAGADAARIPERARDCAPFPSVVEPTGSGFLLDRDPAFWEPRRHHEELDQVRASVLLGHGLQDITGHAFQDAYVWQGMHAPAQPGSGPAHRACPTPARSCQPSPPTWQISGQWGHGPPFADHPSMPAERWRQILFDWLGYWLQGVGSPPPHQVDYQDTAGDWHTSSAWPPSEARDETLFLDGRSLTADRAGGDRRFQAAPTPGNSHATVSALAQAPSPPGVWAWCRQDTAPADGHDSAVAYVSEALGTDALIAGNPYAELELSSDQPGGVIDVSLVRWPAGTSCADLPEVGSVVARGSADLRYHHGGYEPVPFPVGQPTQLRVDLFNNAAAFDAGDRLVLVVSGTEGPGSYTSVTPFAPEITVHAGTSHVVVPFVTGTLG